MLLFAYGNFITVALNFIILAFVIFLMVKQMNRLKRQPPPAPAAPPPTSEDRCRCCARYAMRWKK